MVLERHKRRICLILTLLTAVVSAAGCRGIEKNEHYTESESGTGDASGQQTGADIKTWSVFLYMCGTDLETDSGMATLNMEEIMAVSDTGSMNFVMQTGGTEQWQTEGISSGSLQRWELAGSGFLLADEQPLASMGDPETLGSFLSWGVENYPADKYMVVFWDHGGGSAAGVEFDQLFDNDSLSLDEIGQGLAAAGITFEMVGFDTCLMASLENAAAVAPYGNYMVASEEVEPGSGWDYTAWLQYAADHPEADGLEIGKAICDSYYIKCDGNGDGAMATISVTGLSEIPGLVEKFDAMAGEMTGVTSDMSAFQTFVKGVMRTENYGGNNDDEGYTNMVDLGDLALNTENVLTGTAEAVLDSLFEAVKYNVSGSSRSEANGLSVYFPLAGNNDELTVYADSAAVSGSYLRFIEAVTDWQVPEGIADSVPVMEEAAQEEDYQAELSSFIDDDGYFTLNITDGLESVQSVQFSIYYMDYDYNEYMLLGWDNDINGDWETGIFTDNFRGVWPTVNGYYCSPTLLAEEDGYNLYSIPILLNGEETHLRAAYIWDEEGNGHYEIYGAWNGIDSETGMSSRDMIKLKDGDEIALLFDAINWETGEENTYEMGSFTADGDIIMEESELFNGDYLYQYKVTDVFGRETYSDEVIMECKDGEIFVYETVTE